MRARPDEVYASRRAPAMRAESCNCNFQVISGLVYFTGIDAEQGVKPAPADKARNKGDSRGAAEYIGGGTRGPVRGENQRKTGYYPYHPVHTADIFSYHDLPP